MEMIKLVMEWYRNDSVRYQVSSVRSMAPQVDVTANGDTEPTAWEYTTGARLRGELICPNVGTALRLRKAATVSLRLPIALGRVSAVFGWALLTKR